VTARARAEGVTGPGGVDRRDSQFELGEVPQQRDRLGEVVGRQRQLGGAPGAEGVAHGGQDVGGLVA
jgi:hypothetical protein